MEGNKDDALKCLKIGKQALDSGNRDRAIKFLSKACRLDPSLSIDHLLSAATAGEPPSPPESAPFRDEEPHSPTRDFPPPPPPPPPPSPSSTSSSTAAPRSSARVSSEGSASITYTEEQLSIVRQIKKQKDYYQILGVERACTVEDVRKAYRKLSLKVHPDKNKAPGAEEAFKAVSKAFQCLSNEESRKRYDLVGPDEAAYDNRPARRHHGANGFNGFYDTEFDPDEIFRNFFFGGGVNQATTPFGTFRFRTGGMSGPSNQEMHGAGGFNIRALLQILPIILLLLLNFLPSSEPIYALSRSYGYEHKLETPRSVPYFVKSAKFEQDYPSQSPERIALEQRVEREYVGILSQNCRLELQRRQWGLSYQTPHCDMLNKFEATA